MNCCDVAPEIPLTEICAVVGVIAIDRMAEFVTVTVAVPLIVPEVAVTVAVPALTPVTKPFELTVATLAADVLQVKLGRWLVVLPSVLTPLAVNCTVCAFTTEGLAGVTLMLCRAGLTKKPWQLESITARARTARKDPVDAIRAPRFTTGICKLGTRGEGVSSSSLLETAARNQRTGR